jgi:hypothetical protein
MAVRLSREDRAEMTRAATAGRLAKFERQVDPEGRLSLPERRYRAEQARRADMLRLAHRSAEKRRQAATRAAGRVGGS